MQINLIDIQVTDEDFGPYLQFEIPESEFRGFINIGDWYYDVCDFYTENGFMEKYKDDLLGLVEKWISDGNLLKFTSHTYPKWTDLNETVLHLIDNHRFEMGFVNPTDYVNEMDLFNKRVNGCTELLAKYPALNDVISLDETQVSIMENEDAIILFGNCACYINWYGYKE